eukprot:gene2214-2729_t
MKLRNGFRNRNLLFNDVVGLNRHLKSQYSTLKILNTLHLHCSPQTAIQLFGEEYNNKKEDDSELAKNKEISSSSSGGSDSSSGLGIFSNIKKRAFNYFYSIAKLDRKILLSNLVTLRLKMKFYTLNTIGPGGMIQMDDNWSPRLLFRNIGEYAVNLEHFLFSTSCLEVSTILLLFQSIKDKPLKSLSLSFATDFINSPKTTNIHQQTIDKGIFNFGSDLFRNHLEKLESLKLRNKELTEIILKEFSTATTDQLEFKSLNVLDIIEPILMKLELEKFLLSLKLKRLKIFCMGDTHLEFLQNHPTITDLSLKKGFDFHNQPISIQTPAPSIPLNTSIKEFAIKKLRNPRDQFIFNQFLTRMKFLKKLEISNHFYAQPNGLIQLLIPNNELETSCLGLDYLILSNESFFPRELISKLANGIPLISDSEFIDIHLPQYNQQIKQLQDHYLKDINHLISVQEQLIQSTTNHYNQQIDIVQEQFRNIIIAIQNRELDFRLQLEKLKDNEVFKLSTELSRLDHNKSVIQSFITNSNSNSVISNSSVDIIDKLDKDEILLEKYQINNFIKEIDSDQDGCNNQVDLYSFKPIVVGNNGDNQSVEELMGTMNKFGKLEDDTKQRIYIIGGEHTQTKQIFSHILSNGDEGQSIELDKEYSLNSIKTSTILIKKNQFIKDDTIYIFGSNNKDKSIKKYTINNNNRLEIIENKVVIGTCPTVIYDGGKYIYIFGGHIFESKFVGSRLYESKRIMRFDISIDQLDQDFSAQLTVGRSYSSGCFDGVRYFYLLNGFTENSKILNNIERFDLETKKSEIIFTFNNDEEDTDDGSSSSSKSDSDHHSIW